MIVYANNGRARWLRYLTGRATNGDVLVKLWVNNVTPTPASAIGVFDEMLDHGYLAQTIGKLTWAVSDVSETDSIASAPPVHWTFTAGSAVNVYGYYVVDYDGEWLLAERFPAPLLVQEAGTTLNLSLSWRLRTPAV